MKHKGTWEEMTKGTKEQDGKQQNGISKSPHQ